MTLICPHCGQQLTADTMPGGNTARCPKCGADMPVPPPAPPSADKASPSPASALPDSERTQIAGPDEVQPGPTAPAKIVKTLQVNIDRGARTITQFMADRHLEGGVDLQSTDEKTGASAILTAEQGRKYELGDVVATGGMGAVLSAKDVNLRRQVAMKVMLDPGHVTDEQIMRFIQEAQVTGQLQHPSIVPLYELGVDASGNVFYTMKLIKGRTLKDVLKDIRAGEAKVAAEYPLSRLLTIFQRIGDAIAFAHSKRVIHRDLKPENVMVGEYGEVQVMDWGLAKVLARKGKVGAPLAGARGRRAATPLQDIDSVRADVGSEVLKTMDGAVMGTPGFMAPEQAEGRTEEIDERTDIYALGGILYNMLTLHPPVEGKTLAEMLGKVTSGEIVPPSEYGKKGSAPALQPSNTPLLLPHLPGGEVPNSLSAVAMKALALEMGDRYPAVKDLQADIEAYQNGFATGAEKAGLGRQMALLVKRHKGIVATLAACLVVIVAGATGFMLKVMASERKAVRNLERYEASQAERAKDRKKSAPAMLRSGRISIEQRQWDDALTALQTAIEYDSDFGEARLLQVSADGRNLASGDKHGEIKLWDQETGQVRATFRRHEEGVSAICFSADSMTLSSIDGKGTIRHWRAK